jgi:hypothetical protein
MKKNNGYQYINDGNVHENDEVEIVYDKELEDYLVERTIADNPKLNPDDVRNKIRAAGLALIVHKGQVVGIFNPNNSEDLRNHIANTSKNNNYERTVIAKTKVNRVVAGKLNFSEKKSLKDLHNDKNPANKAVFGVVGSEGQIDPKNSDVEKESIKDIKNDGLYSNVGRTYVLVKGADGRYIPVPLRLKRYGDPGISENSPVSSRINHILGEIVNHSVKVLNK